MKKFKAILSIILVVLTIFTASSCSLFYNPSGKNTHTNEDVETIINEDVEITIYNENEANTYNVKTEEIAVVDTFSKPGYRFKGYYSQIENGEQYFDSDGKSLVNWKKSFPKTLYAQWESIYDMSYTSQEYYTEAKGSRDGMGITLELPDEFKSAISDNPSAKIKLTINMKAKYISDWSNYPLTVSVRDKSGADGEKIAQDSAPLGDEYQNYNFEFTFEAHKLKNGKFYVWMNNKGFQYYICMYVKDLSYSLEFVE